MKIKVLVLAGTVSVFLIERWQDDQMAQEETEDSVKKELIFPHTSLYVPWQTTLAIIFQAPLWKWST